MDVDIEQVNDKKDITISEPSMWA